MIKADLITNESILYNFIFSEENRNFTKDELISSVRGIRESISEYEIELYLNDLLTKDLVRNNINCYFVPQE